MSDADVEARYRRIGMLPPMNDSEENISILKNIERTRHFKIWHDHTPILNHCFIAFTIAWIYDVANFLTSAEYHRKFPERKEVDIASAVEQPKLYILGQSGSSDAEQIKYLKTRVDDLTTLSDTISVGDVEVKDVLRLFSGDGPAREFEAAEDQGLSTERERNVIRNDSERSISTEDQGLSTDATRNGSERPISTEDQGLSTDATRNGSERPISTEDQGFSTDTTRNNSERPISTEDQGLTITERERNVTRNSSQRPIYTVLAKLPVTDEKSQHVNNKSCRKPPPEISSLQKGSSSRKPSLKRKISYQKKNPRRKVFVSDLSESSDLDPFGLNDEDSSDSDQLATPTIVTGKISTIELVEQALGPTKEVENFKKYRGLLQNYPNERSFSEKYEQAKATLSFKVLAERTKYRREKSRSLEFLEQLKKLLIHWGLKPNTID